MKGFFQALQPRLVLLIILVALPGVGLLVIHTFEKRQEAIENAHRRAVDTVDLLASDQAHLLKETRRFLKRLAQAPEVQRPDAPDCSAFLSQILEFSPRYVNLGVPRADGELLCNALPLNRRVNVADRPYIRRAMETGGFSIGEFQMDRAAGVTSVNLAYPVIHSGDDGIVGIAVAVISLEWWSRRLSESL